MNHSLACFRRTHLGLQSVLYLRIRLDNATTTCHEFKSHILNNLCIAWRTHIFSAACRHQESLPHLPDCQHRQRMHLFIYFTKTDAYFTNTIEVCQMCFLLTRVSCWAFVSGYACTIPSKHAMNWGFTITMSAGHGEGHGHCGF